MYLYVGGMYPYVSGMYLFVTESYVSRTYPYVIGMYPYVPVCSVCYSYVTRMLVVVPVWCFSHDREGSVNPFCTA